MLKDIVDTDNVQYALMLLTKLHIPPVGNNIVHRSELYEKLNTGLRQKLILIFAPAGFRKTTVVSNWIDKPSI
jgi:LuxR family maltose regulon positive regulatory protein